MTPAGEVVSADVEITVVIVTVGGSRLLDRNLAAIAAGRRRPDEVVIVDQRPNARDLAVPAVLSDAAIPFQRLAIPPTGVSAARNAGAAAASGETLAFTDDDCVPDGDWLASLAEAVEPEQVAAATGRVLPLDEGIPGMTAVSSRTDTRKRLFRIGDGSFGPWEIGTGGNLLIERSAFTAVGGFSPEFGPGAEFRTAEDIEFLDRVIASGRAIQYAPAAVVFHEMKPPAGRMARRIPYGYGMGAMIARLPRGRRRGTAARYLRMQSRVLVSALVRLRLRKTAETALTLVGAARGFLAAGRSG